MYPEGFGAVVAGCGFAGVVAGYLLWRRLGVRVLVVDRGCCGCGAGDSAGVVRLYRPGGRARHLVERGWRVLNEIRELCSHLPLFRRTGVLSIVGSGESMENVVGGRVVGPGVFEGVWIGEGEVGVWEPRGGLLDYYSVVECLLGVLTGRGGGVVYEHRGWSITGEGVRVEGLGLLDTRIVVLAEQGDGLVEEVAVYSHLGRRAPPAVVDYVNGLISRPETGYATRIITRKPGVSDEAAEKCPAPLGARGAEERLQGLLDNALPIARWRKSIGGLAGLKREKTIYRILEPPDPLIALGLADTLTDAASGEEGEVEVFRVTL